MHLLVDSTGLKLIGAGEWLVEKHGTKRRRSWRKMHLGVDADTGRIVAATLTDRDVDDAAQVGPLLDQVEGSVAAGRGGRRLRPRKRLRRRGRVPPRGGGRRASMLDSGAQRHGRDRADTARPPPPAHRREGQDGMAKSGGLQRACPGRGGHLALQTGDRGRATLAHRPASRGRGGCRRPRAQPHVGVWDARTTSASPDPGTG